MQQLDPAVVRVWSVLGAVPGLVAAVVALVGVGATGGHPLAWAGLVLAAGGVVVGGGIVPRLRYRHVRWGIDDGVLRVRSGIVWRADAAVPVYRIQHVDLEQGPLERWAGIQQLTVHTASPVADVTLPGISVTDAPALRTRLLTLSRDAVVAHGAGEGSDAV